MGSFDVLTPAFHAGKTLIRSYVMKNWLMPAALMLTATLGATAKELKIGDKAPPLTIEQWIKGSPVDPTKGGAEPIYVVEFWATWCGPCRQSIPHLSELQKHFDKKITVVGVSNETPEVIKSFLRTWDKKMQYTVAVDKDNKTSSAYMEAAGVNGIPHSFIVKEGKLVWHGHPMEMDDQLVKLTGDKEFAAAMEKSQAKSRKRSEMAMKAGMAMKSEKWDDAIKILDDMIAVDAADYEVMAQKYYLLLVKKKDAKAAAEYGAKMVQVVEDADLLDAVAFSILMEEEFQPVKDPKTALAMSTKAAKLSPKDPGVLATLARAQFENGNGAEAVKSAEAALQVAEDDQLKEEIQKSLEKYRGTKTGGTPGATKGEAGSKG